MKHESTNDPIRPLLRAIDESIAKARARRLGADAGSAEQADSIFQNHSIAPSPVRADDAELHVNPDGTPTLKAKRKIATSFDTPMPTRSIWDRKAG